MKKILMILCIILNLFLVGCMNNVNDLGSGEDIENGNNIQSGDEGLESGDFIQNDDMNKEDESKIKGKLFYFVGSELIAVSENGNIKAVHDENGKRNIGITYDELLSQNYFSSYSLKEGINNKLDSVKLAIFEDEDLININDSIVKVLLPYGENIGTDKTYLSDIKYDIYKIKLPVQVSGDIAEFDAFQAIGDNGYGYWLELAKNNAFVTNADFELKFEEESQNLGLSSAVINEIEKYVENNDIAQELEYFCTSQYVTDLNNDNKIEKIYVVETYNKDRENNTFAYYNNNEVVRTGAFSLVLIEKEDGNIEILFESNIKPFVNNSDEIISSGDFFVDNVLGYIEQPDLYIVDLNNDNKKEIIIDAVGIELEGGRQMQIYGMVEGKYNKIATSYYGYGH